MVFLVIPFVNIDAIKYGFTVKNNDNLRKNMNIKIIYPEWDLSYVHQNVNQF